VSIFIRDSSIFLICFLLHFFVELGLPVGIAALQSVRTVASLAPEATDHSLILLWVGGGDYCIVDFVLFSGKISSVLVWI